MGILNVQGIYEDGAVVHLPGEAKEYRTELLAIHKTHLMETKAKEMKHYIFFTSGGYSKNMESDL